jgi:hypothetical protein
LPAFLQGRQASLRQSQSIQGRRILSSICTHSSLLYRQSSTEHLWTRPNKWTRVGSRTNAWCVVEAVHGCVPDPPKNFLLVHPLGCPSGNSMYTNSHVAHVGTPFRYPLDALSGPSALWLRRTHVPSQNTAYVSVGLFFHSVSSCHYPHFVPPVTLSILFENFSIIGSTSMSFGRGTRNAMSPRRFKGSPLKIVRLNEFLASEVMLRYVFGTRSTRSDLFTFIANA